MRRAKHVHAGIALLHEDGVARDLDIEARAPRKEARYQHADGPGHVDFDAEQRVVLAAQEDPLAKQRDPKEGILRQVAALGAPQASAGRRVDEVHHVLSRGRIDDLRFT